MANEKEEYSGRFALRLPRGIHRRAAIYAQREGVSLNQLLVAIIAERASIEEKMDELADLVAQKLLERMPLTAGTGTKVVTMIPYWTASTAQPQPQEQDQEQDQGQGREEG